jgi:hypothetical protein
MAKCYWCDATLSKENTTRDHLFCKFIRKTYNCMTGSIVIACKKCNGTRGGISSLFQVVYYLNSGKQFGLSEKEFLKSRRKLTNRMIWFREIINNKVSIKFKELCLREIDTILMYQPKLS